MSRGFRVLRGVFLALLAAIALFVLAGYVALRGSLPELDGEATLEDLVSPVTVERDALGVPTIVAADSADAYRALGFLHAQERYFEMDLMRRAAAGELAELFGAAALPLDERARAHRFRARAQAMIGHTPAAQRARVEAYVAGVNAGLGALGVRPFPYLLLRLQPEPWRNEDVALIGYAMFFDLVGGRNDRELALEHLHRAVPEDYYRFITSPGTEWDAPLIGPPFAPAAVPPASVIDLRRYERGLFGRRVAVGGEIAPGSNNFAVAGALTAHGGALVASDMHLRLRVPSIWYRARLRFGHGDGARELNGVTLPGVPALIAGSNGHVAWGYTNSYGDWMDWVRVHWTDATRTRYRLPDGGSEPVQTHRETIAVAGADDATLEVVETRWGPVLHDDGGLASLALAWTAHHARASNLDVIDLEAARDVSEALAVAARAGMPPQNFVVGDSGGRIAWTVIGAIPERGDCEPARPCDSLAGDPGWRGWIGAERRPQLVDPPQQRLWTANARTADGDALALIGDGGYALGARARQIRDALYARERFAAADLMAIQLDDRALFLERWWRLLRDVLQRHTDDAALAELARHTGRRDERASIDAVSHRLVRAFRLEVHRRVLDGLAVPVRAANPDYELPPLTQGEGVVWTLISERPPHLLGPHYADWDALLHDAARAVVAELGALPGGLAARTWGEANTSAIRHPLSRAVPWLSWLLDMPARPLPGDVAMPRVQGPAFGASERFVVAPGREAEGVFHMPSGQSGHPLSPFYGAGHEDWEQGRPTPFLPGLPEYRLTLHP
jgi:penicillin amidase